MLPIKEKKDIDGMTKIVKQLGPTERLILMSNANVLLARQEIEKKTVKS